MYLYPGISLAAVANSAPIVVGSGAIQLGQQQNAGVFNISSLGLVCTLSAGGVLTYSVQITADPPSAITHWNNHDTLNGLTASAYGSIIYPITALRLVVSAYTSGTINLGVGQWP